MKMQEKESLELSVVMPCRNEEATIGFCVDEARAFMDKYEINGEVLVADNASSDASAEIAKKHGARVITEEKRGYGNAIRAGIANSRGRVLIIGDGDTTYDFLHLEEMYRLLAQAWSRGVCHGLTAGECGSSPSAGEPAFIRMFMIFIAASEDFHAAQPSGLIFRQGVWNLPRK